MGARAEDQAIWHALVGNPTPLPMLFREALFLAPREDTPPVIILRTPEERERVGGGGYAKERQELERRLRAVPHLRTGRAGGWDGDALHDL